VLGALENQLSEWEDSDQTFILTTLNKQHDKLAGVFHRFVEEQVRTIEDMKVTAKKRQGVLIMFKIFPVHFSPYQVLNIGICREGRGTIRVAYAYSHPGCPGNSQRGVRKDQ